MKPMNCCVPLCINNFRNSPNLSFLPHPEGQNIAEDICSVDSKRESKVKVWQHLPSIFPWKKEHSKRRTVSRVRQQDIVKRVKSEGRPELKDIASTRVGNIGQDFRTGPYLITHTTFVLKEQ